MTLSQLEAGLASHQAAADEAWAEYHRHTNLAAWYEAELNKARRHEKRVAAVDEALRRVA